MEFTNFKDLKVYKPDPEKIKEQYEEITNRITNAQTPDEATNAILDSLDYKMKYPPTSILFILDKQLIL